MTRGLAQKGAAFRISETELLSGETPSSMITQMLHVIPSQKFFNICSVPASHGKHGGHLSPTSFVLVSLRSGQDSSVVIALTMSDVINTGPSEKDNVGNVQGKSNYPPSFGMATDVATEKPAASETAIACTQKEPSSFEHKGIQLQESLKSDQGSLNIIGQEVVGNEEMCDSRDSDHKERSSDDKLVEDKRIQDQGCPAEIVKRDLLEENPKTIELGKPSYLSGQLQQEKDSEVNNQQLTDVVEQDASCSENKDVIDSVTVDNCEKRADEDKLEKDTPMETEEYSNQLYGFFCIVY